MDRALLVRRRPNDQRAEVPVRLSLLLCVSATALGCAGSQHGRLYSVKDGRTGALVVEDAQSQSGAVRAALPTGESCTGEFSAVVADDPSLAGIDAPPIGRGAERGVVLLACGKDRVLRCLLGRRPGAGFSYGGCKDQQGVEYALVFG